MSAAAANKEKKNSKSSVSVSKTSPEASTFVNDVDTKNNETGKKSGIFEFSQEEFNMLNKTYEDLNMDNQDFSDLKKIPQPTPDASAKELDEIIKDPKIKTTVTEPGKLPPIENTLGANDRLGNITDEEVSNILTEDTKYQNKLIVLLSSKDYINLDIKIGVREGRSIFISKPFYYNSLTKIEEFHIKMKNARLSQISHKYTMIVNRQDRIWNEQEEEFLSLAPAMMEIAAYQQAEMEAKLKLGMSSEDFSRVDVAQFQLAQKVAERRTIRPSSSNLKR